MWNIKIDRFLKGNTIHLCFHNFFCVSRQRKIGRSHTLDNLFCSFFSIFLQGRDIYNFPHQDFGSDYFMVFKHYTNDGEVLKDMHSTTYCTWFQPCLCVLKVHYTFILNQSSRDSDLSNISFTLQKVKLIFQNCTVLWPVFSCMGFPLL